MQRFPTQSAPVPKLNAARARRRWLPAWVLHGMEEYFGVRFRAVRIYESDAVAAAGALALANGNDLWFSPRAYRTADLEGLRLIGHELAHVVQQRNGLTRGVRADDGCITDDPVLEAQADVLGLQAAMACLRQRAGAVRSRRRVPDTSEAILRPAMQAMMSVEQFKSVSQARGKRNKIVPIDDALGVYTKTIATKPHDLPKALTELQRLRAACTNYRRERPNSEREPGVKALMTQVDIEEPVLEFLVKATRAATGAEALRCLMDARQELVERLRSQPPTVRGSTEWLNGATADISNKITGLLKDGEGSWTADAKELVLEDIERLQHISSMAATPGLIRAVLKQILASKNLSQITPGLNTPGAKFNETRGMDTKYTLNHRLVYDGGLRYRIGALVHELTHVCVAEVYGNSVLMFAIPRDATDEQWLNRSRERRGKLAALKQLIVQDKEINSGVLHEEALASNLKTQVDYALGQKVKTNYLKLFKAKLDAQEGVDFVPRIERLCDQGLGSELIEYDSVVNQMLVWCYMQGVSESNPVVESLSTMAAEEMTRRARSTPKPRPAVRAAATTSTVVKPTGAPSFVVPKKPLPVPPVRK